MPSPPIQSCPIRFEIPIGEWLGGKPKAPRTVATSRAIECEGANVAALTIERRKADGFKPEGILVSARIVLPAGEDQRISLLYVLASGAGEIKRVQDSLPGDQGEINFGDPLYLATPTDHDGLVLRVEVGFRAR
jgi:hypothetical protein